MARKKKDTTLEIVEEPTEVSLEDLEGIGPVRLKKLNLNGIYTVDDLLIHGEESLSRMLDISWDDARKMTMVANDALNTDDALSSMIVSGKEYHEYYKKHIEFLTTGHEEFDEITGGYETGVITELFGAFGSGKTQFTMVASLMAQLPKEACCLSCGQTESLEQGKCPIIIDALKNPNNPMCEGTIWKGGGLSKYGKPCRVIYIDSENSYRTERMLRIIYNREVVKTKPQTKTEIKQQADKEPLNDEEYEKAMEYIDNITRARPKTSALQMMLGQQLSGMIDGDFCKKCNKRIIGKDGNPTHQDHPKAKEDMPLMDHNFIQNKPARLVIFDSLTGKFRSEYEGRGTLSDRQMKLKTHVKHIVGAIERKNVVCLVTNQVGEKMDVMGDNIRPVGGNEIGHIFTHRIYLKKSQSMTKDKITAILVDSPNHAKNEVSLELGGKGIQNLST